MRGGTLALAAALGALAATGAVTWAHATMPALPCGFECQWPMGSYSEIPAGVEVGVPFQVSVWYAWEEVPANPAIGTAAGRAPPEGYYAWPDDLGPAGPPEGYAGSEVTIRLPEEIELLGYGPELERRLLWIDGNGRSTYEYTGTLPYRPGSGPQSLLLTFVLNSPVAYADTAVYADLGLSERDAAPRAWTINNAGAGRATVSTDMVEPDPSPPRSFVEELREVTGNPAPTPGPAAWAAAARAAGGPGAAGAGGAGAGAAGGGAGPALVPELRHKHVYPPPVVTPLPESEAPEAARRLGAAGASAADQVIVWGQVKVTGRNDAEANAANVLVCLFDKNDAGKLSVITHTGTDSCTLTDGEGRYGLAVPSTDPDGSGGPDIVVRLLASNSFVSVHALEGNRLVRYEYDLPVRENAPAGSLNMGSARVPENNPFNPAHVVLSEITDAHEFFESEFGYDTPRVLAYLNPLGNAFYSISAAQISLDGRNTGISGPATVLHEYGHHVHASVYAGTYGQNRLPDATHCNPHFFNYPSSEPCAWSEGWANFVSGLVPGSPLVDRGGGNVWDLEAGRYTVNGFPQPFGHGDAVEGRISSLLWDLHDSTDEHGDDISGGTQRLWDALRGSIEASSELPADTIHEFREDWEARGYPSLGEAFALNTIPSRPPQPASLTVHAEDGGAPKSGAGARHASPGQSVVVTLGLSAPASDSPTTSFFGGAASPMSPVGGGGSLWRSAHTVTASTPEGAAVFRVEAAGTAYTPASITSGGNVAVDTTAPAAPTAMFTGQRSAVLEFGEELLPGSVASSAFMVTTAAGSSQTATALHAPGSPRVVLDLGMPVGMGTHTIGIPSALTDLAGNAYAGGAPEATSAHAGAAPPTFSVDVGSIRPLASGFELPIEFSQGVMGKTLAREWVVDLYGRLNSRVTAPAVSAISAGAGEPASEITLATKATRLVLHTAGPMPQEAISLAVRYLPDPANTNSLAGESRLQQSGMPARGDGTNFRGMPSVEEARFVDARTVRLSLDRPLEHSGGTLPFVDAERTVPPSSTTRGTLGFRGAVTFGLSPTLGDTVVEYEPGSHEVTLHSSRQAGASAAHSVAIPPSTMGSAGRYDIRLATVQGAGYSAALEPESHLVAAHTDTGAPSALYAYADSARNRFTMVFTEPLDTDSANAAMFSISAPDPSSPAMTTQFVYQAGSLKIDLLASALEPNVEYTATASGPIKGANGVATTGPPSATATASSSPRLSIVSAQFASPSVLEVTLNRPIDAAHAGRVTVSGLGAVTHQYEPRSMKVTLQTEEAATGGMSYTVNLPRHTRDYAGDPSSMASEETITYTAPADTAPPSVAMIRTVSEPDAMRVHFDEALSPPPSSGFAVVRAGTTADIASIASYVGPDEGGPRVDIGLGTHELLEGARYTVTVPPVSDGSNTSVQQTEEVEHSRAPAALGAAFTGPGSLRLDVSEPLDPDTVGGIAVVGLGEATIEYARGSTAVLLRTSGSPVDGAEYEIRVPPSVTDTGGTSFSDDGAGGPLRTTRITATYEDTSSPGVVRAELRTPTTTAVIFDEDVTFADTARPGLRAAHWTASASPGGSLGVGAVEFPTGTNLIRSLSKSELLRYDSGRTLVLTHGPAPPRSAITVSYAPGSDGGAVTDTASPPNALATAEVRAADATPLSFTARTLSTTSTIVEFGRPLGGFTAASDWAIDTSAPSRISHVGASPVADATRVFAPQGTTSITLAHGATEGPGATPTVGYGAPDSSALRAGTERLGALSAIAADGIAPAVESAGFVGRQVVLLRFTEPLDATTTSAPGAFSVTAPGSGTNLLAATGAVTHHAGSPVVILRLGAGAAQSEHTVTVAASVTDANGVAYAAPASPVTATPSQGTPAEPFTARTASQSQTTVTFSPAVSGTTSASEWTVDGLPATGIAGDASVGPSATLAAGTTSIALSHRPLGSTGATPAVAYSPGASPLMAAGTALGAHTAIATDGAGPSEASTRTASRTTTEVTFREPVQFRGTDANDRKGKWTVSDGVPLAIESVEIKPGTQGTTITITHAQNSGPGAKPSVSYTETGDGSLQDAADNDAVYSDGPASDGVAPSAFAHFEEPIPPNNRFTIRVWLDEEVMGQSPLPQYLVPFAIDRGRSPYLGMPGLALTAEDGSDVPVYLRSVETDSVPLDATAQRELGVEPQGRLTLFLYEEPVAGAPYTLTIPPALSDMSGNALEATLTLVHGADTVGPVLERAAFTGPSTLYAEFDEPLMGSTVISESFTVTAPGSSTNLLASVDSYVPHSRRVTMGLTSAATEGADYSVAATAALQDARRNAHVPGTPATATYDTTPPTASGVRYADDYTLEVSVSEPLDVDTVGLIGIARERLGALDVEYVEDERIVTINIIGPAAGDLNARREARVVIPATVTDANGVAFEPTTLFTDEVSPSAPDPHTAVALSRESTLVLFDPVADRVRFGEGSTPAVRAAHWTVADTRGTPDTSDDVALGVTDATIARDWRAVLLSHAPSQGTGGAPLVRYLAGDDDAGRIRDWAPTPNVLSTDDSIARFADLSGPESVSVMLSLLHDGELADASMPRYANADDTITATLALDEPAGANTPTIDIFGTTAGMEAAPAGQSSTWTHAAMVPASGAAQGELAFEVRAWDAGGNAVTLGPADLPAGRERITIDTAAPGFAARTASSGVTVIEFGEPVSGLLVASDWEVAGGTASGASPSPDGPPSPSLLLSEAVSVALWHGPLDNTSDEPDVVYARPRA